MVGVGGLVHVICMHLVADFCDVSAVSRRFFPQCSRWRLFLAFFQPGQSRSYEQTLKGWGRHARNCTFWRFCRQLSRVSSSMASMGPWGFPAASVSCSAIMHRTPLNRNPWNRSLPQNKHYSYSRISLTSPPWSGSCAHVSSRW